MSTVKFLSLKVELSENPLESYNIYPGSLDAKSFKVSFTRYSASVIKICVPRLFYEPSQISFFSFLKIHKNPLTLSRIFQITQSAFPGKWENPNQNVEKEDLLLSLRKQFDVPFCLFLP